MDHKNGQSLVEFAIIVPILIFFTIGIFEVGHALRNQFVLINISRETARFATRQDYLTIKNDSVIGYDAVVSHSLTSSAGQLKNFDYNSGSAGIIISNIIVSISPTNCLSSTFNILHPDITGNEYLKYQTSNKYQSKIDYDKTAIEAAQKDLKISCGIYDRGAIVKNNHIVIIEVFYDSYQLIGFPLIKNNFTDPIPLYSKTVMRKIKGR